MRLNFSTIRLLPCLGRLLVISLLACAGAVVLLKLLPVSVSTKYLEGLNINGQVKSNSNATRILLFNQRVGVNHNLKINPRGFWSGSDAMIYHAKNHSPGLARKLVKFFMDEKAGSVVDIGGGDGFHVRTLLQNGIFASCYDGNPQAQDVSQGTCATLDLTKPISLARHDWVLSISVGRQIPPPYESMFLQNIDRLNLEGVVIYWGDGRPEVGRVDKSVRANTQVISKFMELGYWNDEGAQNYLRPKNPKSLNHSLLVFRRAKHEDSKVIANHGIVSHGKWGQPEDTPKTTINIAVTSCGMSKLEEADTMLKSAILFSQDAKLRVFAFTDNETLPVFTENMERLKRDAGVIGVDFDYRTQVASFPEASPGMIPWSQMFKPCSLQRLFFPSLLPDVDAVIYLDADSLVVSNLTELWNQFQSMNESQITGLSPITEFGVVSWFTKHGLPHYGVNGLNCGVALMNLTRMRQVGFEDQILKIREDFEKDRPDSSGDQFLQNILYNKHPEYVYVFPCEWNLRRIHCSCFNATINCKCGSAVQNGVSIIHGTNNAFTDKIRLPLFRHIFELFKSFSLTMDSFPSLLDKLKDQFQYEPMKCHINSSAIFYQKMERYIKALTLDGVKK